MHPWSGPTVLGRWLCFGLDCVQPTTFAVRWHHETGGAADKNRHRHHGLCSRCCYCMEQTTSRHSNIYVHGSDICTKNWKLFMPAGASEDFLFCAVEIDSLLLLLLLFWLLFVWLCSGVLPLLLRKFRVISSSRKLGRPYYGILKELCCVGIWNTLCLTYLGVL